MKLSSKPSEIRCLTYLFIGLSQKVDINEKLVRIDQGHIVACKEASLQLANITYLRQVAVLVCLQNKKRCSIF